MADYYTQFSFILPVPEKLQEKANDWLTMQSEKAEEMYEKDHDEWTDLFSDIAFQMEPEGLWVWSDESGNVEAAIQFSTEYLRYMNIEDGVYISWANTCSKPRLDSFNGGAVVVTKDGVVSETWSDKAVDMARKLGVNILNI